MRYRSGGIPLRLLGQAILIPPFEPGSGQLGGKHPHKSDQCRGDSNRRDHNLEEAWIDVNPFLWSAETGSGKEEALEG